MKSQLHTRRLRHILSAALIALSLAACLPSKPAETSAPGVPTPSPEPPDESRIEFNVKVEGGPGSLVLDNPRVGLDALSGYQSVMVMAFDGTVDGHPQKWSNTYTMLVNNTPAMMRQLTVAYTTEPPDESIRPPLPQTETDGIIFTGDDSTGCDATLIGPNTPSLAETEPATLMQLIVGAEEAGSKTVNEIATTHYTFDEKSLPLSGGQPFSGEIWVASEGGVVVKYTLSAQGGPDFFGDGVEGTMTWEYNLTIANQSMEIVKPASCPVGKLDAPTMSGATDVVEEVSFLTYHLPDAKIDDVIAFYKEEMTARGWTASENPVIEPDKFGSLVFTKDDLAVSVSAYILEGVTTVTVSLGSAIPQKAE